MQSLDHEAEAQFSQPVRQITTMLAITALVSVGAYLALPRVAPLFLANIYLNGVIGLVFFIGVLACFWQILQLISAVSWIVGFAEQRQGHELTRAPRLLVPLASLLRSRGTHTQIGATSARSILDSVAVRMDESRDITRYLINLLIFLGLLGTFYGLATTVPAVVDTIRSLSPKEGESAMQVFAKLMGGLQKQLGGMGTAFSSSLLGLTGSLVVGLLELFAGHGQNRFYRELEEWLSTITRVGLAAGDGDGGSIDEGAVATVLDHMIEQMNSLQSLFARAEAGRGESDKNIGALTRSVNDLVERLERPVDSEPDPAALLERIADGQDRIAAALRAAADDGTAHVDAESRMRLRSIDVQLLRILEEMSAGRQETLADLRSELASLTKVLRQNMRAAPAGRKSAEGR